MPTETLTERDPEQSLPNDGITRVLGHPAAFLATAALLLALFGWTFVANPDRVAPTKDPAYYTWRTEAMISEKPVKQLEIEGAFNMFAGGYRVAAPVIGGFLRNIPGISTLRVTVLFMVIIPVLTALLLGGFAYRHRRDPLIFHAVAIGSASLFLTPPFVGYLDNVLCLLFLAAALFFIESTRTSWPARLVFGGLLLASGLTHPTTLAIFCITLGAMAAARLIYRRFDLKSVLRDDGPLLITAFVSAVVMYAIWKVGIWGKSASLSDAALPPPYDSDFFVTRMNGWIEVMRPVLNGPLFLIGAVGVLMAGRRAAEDELSRVSIVWLAPLAGLFGFLGGLTYPYYRFFNTTLSWVLLVGLGAYFLIRFVQKRATGTAATALVILASVAIAFVFATNLTKGFESAGWNDPEKGWLSDSERRDLDVLRSALGDEDEDRPIVFVIDDEPAEPFQIWGFTKLSGNTSRYAMPPGHIDQAYMYLGELENYLAGEPTLRGEETYDKLSPALLEDSEAAVEASGQEPLVVLARIFNQKGANEALADGNGTLPPGAEEVLVLAEGAISVDGSVQTQYSELDVEEGGATDILIALVGLLLLLIPGFFLLRWALPDAAFAESLGLVPGLSLVALALGGTIFLAVFRSPFSSGMSWLAFALITAASAASFLLRRSKSEAPAALS